MALQKAGSLTPKGTPPQPTRLATKRKRLAWWVEHDLKAQQARDRKKAQAEQVRKALAQAARDRAHAEAEAKRKAARR